MTEEKCNSPSRWPTAKTEQKAVNVLINCILETDYIQPFIKDNDREPSWDGCLYLYSGPEQTKDQIVGRASVQVKGKRCASFPRDDVEKYPVELSDLRNYQVDGGAILFCVRFVGEEYRIYYAHLFPSQIQKLLANHTGKKTKTVELQRYPSDPEEQRNLLAFFLKHSKRHASYGRPEFSPNLDAIFKRGNFRFEFTRFGTPKTIAELPFWAPDALRYVFDEETLTYLPCEEITFNEIVAQGKAHITIGDQVFFDTAEQIITPPNTVVTTFCDGLLKYDGSKLNLCLLGPLRASTEAIRFFLAAAEAQGFSIEGGITVKLNGIAPKIRSELRRQLKYRETMLAAYRQFRLNVDADISQYADDDFLHSNILVNASLGPIPVDRLPVNIKPPASVTWKIGQESILLNVCSIDNDPEYCVLDDFFQHPGGLYYTLPTGEKKTTSPFLTLTQSDFVHAVNLNCSTVITSLQEFYTPEIKRYVNDVLLNMLLAFDECEKIKRYERASLLLEAAEELNEFLLDKDKTDVVGYINRLQIIKRKRELDDATKETTMNVLETTTQVIEHFALNLLLDAKPHAQKYWRKLTLDEKKIVCAWPLARFMNEQDFPLAESPAEPSV